MTEIVSALYEADVVPARKRNETRKRYRIDVPIDFTVTTRGSLAPAVEIVNLDFRGEEQPPLTLHSFGGRLWKPHVAASARAGKPELLLPTAASESAAMKWTDFAGWLGGKAGLYHGATQHDDPLERDRGRIIHERRLDEDGRAQTREKYVAASEFPRIEDEETKAVLWDNRASTEEALRRAATSLLVVDGRIWTESEEPVLELAKSNDGKGREINLIIPDSPTDWQTLRHFRLDRLDDMRAWAARQGKSVVPVPMGAEREEIVLRGRARIMEPSVLKRDDARRVLLSRLRRILHEGAVLARRIPSAAVDSYVELKKVLRTGGDTGLPTPEMYRHVEIFSGAVAALSGLDAEDFAQQRKTREAVSPVLTRWNGFEKAGHSADGSYGSPVAAPR